MPTESANVAESSWKGTTSIVPSIVGISAATSLLPLVASATLIVDTTLALPHKHYEIQIESSAVSYVTKLEIVSSEAASLFRPRTELGKRLLALRNKAIGKGMKLLSAEEVVDEVIRRRGEAE